MMLARSGVRSTDRRSRRHAVVAALVCLVAGSAALVPNAARAASMSTISETLSVPLTQTNWQPGTAGLTNPLQFKKFDPALGTLNSVSIALGYAFNHDISLTFSSASTLTESAKDSSVVVKGPDGSVYLTGAPAPVSETRTNTTGPFPQTVTIPTIAQAGNTGPLVLTSPADLALFTEAATGDKIGLPVVAQSNSEFSSSTGNGSGRIITNAGADVTVSYTYTPVPEPTTLAVLGLGGAALFAARRRAARR